VLCWHLRIWKQWEAESFSGETTDAGESLEPTYEAESAILALEDEAERAILALEDLRVIWLISESESEGFSRMGQCSRP
jgi:hypothetical protein